MGLLARREASETVATSAPRLWGRAAIAIAVTAACTAVGELATAFSAIVMGISIGVSVAVLGIVEGVNDLLAGASRVTAAHAAHSRAARLAPAIPTLAAILVAAFGSVSTAWQAAMLRWATGALVESSEPLQERELAGAGDREAARGTSNLVAGGAAALAVGAGLAAYATAGLKAALAVALIPAPVITIVAWRAAAAPPEPAAAVAPTSDPRPALRDIVCGRAGLLLLGLAAFEMGNVAAALLVLRSVLVLSPEHGTVIAVELALTMYAVHNVAATLAGARARRTAAQGPRCGPLAAAALLFLVAYGGFALSSPGVPLLFGCFVATGIATGSVRSGERMAVRALVDEHSQEAAIGLLATLQAFGNFTAATATGVLWDVVSIRAALAYLGAWLAVSTIGLLAAGIDRGAGESVSE